MAVRDPTCSPDLVSLLSLNLGWVVGSHEVEESENRAVAGIGSVVVVSVDYRM